MGCLKFLLQLGVEVWDFDDGTTITTGRPVGCLSVTVKNLQKSMEISTPDGIFDDFMHN